MRILLIEDNPGDVRLLQEHLLNDRRSPEEFQLLHVDRLARGLERLAEAQVDIVLLDLSLPDSQGIATLTQVRAAAPAVSIVVLTSLDDERLGMQLLQAGAQDYLVKGEVTGSLLRRSLRYAVERKRAERALLESEARFRAIVDHSPGLVFLKDLEGRYVHVNRQYERILHMTCDDIVGKTDEELFPLEQAAAFRANDRKVLDAGVALEFEEVALHDDGPHTSIVFKFPLRKEDGEPYAICGITTDITNRKRMEERLQRTLGELRTLSQRLDGIREEERTRIARELHDELGVRLTCLKLDLARMQSLMAGPVFLREKAQDKVRSMMTEVDSTIASVQRLVVELRPGILDDLGLVPAIEWQCQDFERRSGTRCVCKAPNPAIDLDRAHATAAFRICQEALTNVARHAKATLVRVLVEQTNGELLLEIQDDGQGISVEQITDSSSLGLLGMRERARGLGGRLDIAARPGGKGTMVALRLPCSEKPPVGTSPESACEGRP